MTDKEKIKKEIERQIEKGKVKCQQSRENNDRESFVAWSAHIATCGQLLVFINSLPEEPASEDFEEEMIKWHKQHFNGDRDWDKTSGEYLTRKSQLDIARHFAEWQHGKDFDDLLLSEMKFPKEFYEKGRLDTIDGMMKDAVETTIVNDWQYGKDPDHAIIPAIHQRIEGFDAGDKVKIMIIKEE